jgi:hypothetical protein
MTGGAPVTASFRSGQASGVGCYAFLSTASAISQLAGGLKVGSVSAQTEVFEVVGNAAITGVYKVGTTQVVGARQTGTPNAASDLATAIALLNDIRTKLITHGLIS